MIPSITVTIYFGSEKWDGPKSLFEMMEEGEARVNVCQAIQEMREEEQLKGRKIGEKIGEARGMKIGEERNARMLNELMKRLLQDKRMDDLNRSLDDRDYQIKLLVEYGIK